jgi:uncharacterized membrane protein YeaQ/YmgE (transglycosylase-associated protein family)
MNLLTWLVIGGAVGWIASRVMVVDPREGILVNVLIGIAGALSAGFVLTPGGSALGLVASLVGSIVLLSVVHLVLRRPAY